MYLSLQLLELLCACRKSSVSQKSHVLHISASKLRLLKISAMRMTLKRRPHQISANGTDFAHISVTGADFQCVYFPQWYMYTMSCGGLSCVRQGSAEAFGVTWRHSSPLGSDHCYRRTQTPAQLCHSDHFPELSILRLGELVSEYKEGVHKAQIKTPL